MKRQFSVIKVATLLATVLIILTALTIGSLWIFDMVDMFELQLKEREELYISSNKQIMESQVNLIYEYAMRRRESAESLLKHDIRQRTNEAIAIAEHIYSSNNGNVSNEEIEKRIKDALRPISFNDGRGYYFIVSMDGIEQLYPPFPEFEGQNVLDLQDEKGNYVIRDEINIVSENGEGFVTDYWKKPGKEDGLIYEKISFVKFFEPLNWYIGTGEYIDDVERDLKVDVLNEVNNVHFGINNEQYIFVVSHEGIELANGNYPDLIGHSIVDLKDNNGISIYEEEFKAISEYPNGSYLHHSWFGLDGTSMNRETMTFVRNYEDWGWILGSTLYLDTLSMGLEQMKVEFEKKIEKQIVRVVFFIGMMLLLLIVAFQYMSKKIAYTTDKFNEFFRSAAKDHNEINLAEVHFNEMIVLAESANQMIRERKIIDDKVRRLTITDGMTETYNHQHIFERLKAEIKLEQEPLSIILFDMDDFKKINDSYGHLVGDETLRKVADFMLGTVRTTDAVGRYGGEEFLVILPQTSKQTAFDVAERIRKKIASMALSVDSDITISGGVVEWKKGESIKELIKRADDAMYEAKRTGKNRIVMG
ncbi:MAG: cache domain-containing protein [Tissierellales bacterium]|nr:cache domain-containing protein [Tissierellales bacterium]MBN2827916.1 cache domain-containing protein [Tissierellales bacterium]